MRTLCISNINKHHPYFEKIDEYAFACKNVYNTALYEYRQNFFHQEELWSCFDMICYFKEKENYDDLNTKMIPEKVKQQIIKQVYENVKTFYSSKSDTASAALPRYLHKENGRANIILTNQAILKKKFIKENKIAFNYNNFCFEFDISNLIKKLKLQFENIQQVRVIYNHTYKSYKVLLYVKNNVISNESNKLNSSNEFNSFVESLDSLKTTNNNDLTINETNVAAIDLGLNNLMSLVFQNERILFDGKPLKKINHHFNKNLAKLQSQRDKAINELKETETKIKQMEEDAIWFYELRLRLEYENYDFNDKKYKKLIKQQDKLIKEINKTKTRIEKIYEKRNNRIKYCLHKTSHELVELLASKGISKIVIGYNKNWKQDINLGKVNNQNFVQIPFKTLIDYITYKASVYNIEVITHEESYTSKCSFLDDEEIRKHDDCDYVGKRVKRGLFISKHKMEIHADINAAYNIAKKAGFNLLKLETFTPCSWAIVKRIQFN